MASNAPLQPGFAFSGQARNRLSYSQVKQLAEAYGLPGDAIAQIAKGESGMYADVQQHDPGDGMVGYGLLQMTPNAWGKNSAAFKYMQSLGGVAAMRDPAKNMAMARFLYKAAGNRLTPWYGTRYLTNRSGEGTLGPVDHSKLGGTEPAAAGSPATQTTTTRTTPGVDNSAQRGALIASFLSQKGADPLQFAMGVRALRDTPGTTVTTPASSSPAATPAQDVSAAPTVKGTADFEGKQVAAWIAPVLAYARQQGWKGTVNSGYRSFAEQTRIYNSGVRPAARPGTSNHEGADFPRGAVDVSDAAQLSAIIAKSKYARLLQWAGAKDPVHFSHPHGGSY